MVVAGLVIMVLTIACILFGLGILVGEPLCSSRFVRAAFSIASIPAPGVCWCRLSGFATCCSAWASLWVSAALAALRGLLVLLVGATVVKFCILFGLGILVGELLLLKACSHLGSAGAGLAGWPPL